LGVNNKKMADKKVGKVTHYYDKIGVAVVDLEDTLKVGDKIKISDDDVEFEQVVESMQVEHEGIDEAEGGQAIGLKVKEEVKAGASVYKTE